MKSKTFERWSWYELGGARTRSALDTRAAVWPALDCLTARSTTARSLISSEKTTSDGRRRGSAPTHLGGLWWAAETGNQQFSQHVHGVGGAKRLLAGGNMTGATRRPRPLDTLWRSATDRQRRRRRRLRRRPFISPRYSRRALPRRPPASSGIGNNHVATRSIRNHLLRSARAPTTRAALRLISNKTVFTFAAAASPRYSPPPSLLSEAAELRWQSQTVV